MKKVEFYYEGYFFFFLKVWFDFILCCFFYGLYEYRDLFDIE